MQEYSYKDDSIMMPQLITVHDIHAAIADVGVFPYQNTLVQEMGGEFWFVETKLVEGEDTKPIRLAGLKSSGWGVEPHSFDKTVWFAWKVHPVPLRLAWFVIDALRLKSEAMQLGTTSGDKPVKQAVYLTPGKEFMGVKIEKRTEVPAELRPVVVERL